MASTLKTPEELRTAGIDALNEALGPVDAVRFLRLFTSGAGDYTADRDRIIGTPSLDEIENDLSGANRHSSEA